MTSVRFTKKLSNTEYSAVVDGVPTRIFLCAGKKIEDVATVVKESLAPTQKLSWQESRIAEYGSVKDQLDEMFHDFDAWKARIAAIKAEYPKV